MFLGNVSVCDNYKQLVSMVSILINTMEHGYSSEFTYSEKSLTPVSLHEFHCTLQRKFRFKTIFYTVSFFGRI